MHLAVSLNMASAAGQAAELDFGRIAGFVRKAEAAGLDMVVISDSAVSSGRSSSPFEATTLLAALATVTNRIGLVAAASTVAHQPYNLARRFASLDIISHGRIGWQAPMVQDPREAAKFSRLEGFSGDDFRRRVEEYIGIVQGLWQGWDADALLFDTSGGRFHDPQKMHLLDHKGEYFSVRGPLNVARSPQDMPVLVLSGLSEPDMDIAARTADVILLDERSAENAKAWYDDLKHRVTACGRDPDAVKVLMNIIPVIDGAKATHAIGIEIAAEPDVLADRLDALFQSKSCDGFNILMPPLTGVLDDFVDGGLPELCRLGLCRSGYSGATLRSHLGLARGGDR